MSRRTLTLAVLAAGLAVAFAAGPVQRAVHMYLPSGWRLAPAGEPTKVGDMLVGAEASPDGKWAAFASVGQGDHKVFLFDRATGKLVDTTSIGRGWVGMGWSVDSATLYVSGGTSSVVHQIAVASDGQMTRGKALSIAGVAANKGWFSGLAVLPDSIVLASAASDTLYKISLSDGHTIATKALESGDSPYQVRLAPNGHLYVSLQGNAKIAEVDPADLSVVRIAKTGRHPNDLKVVADRLFVACGNEDTVDVFSMSGLTKEESVVVRPWPDAPAGSTPNGLAVSNDGKRLFAALSDDNAVAVLDIATKGRTVVQGYVATGAYPSALGTTTDGKRILIGSSKSLGTGPNDRTEKINPVAGSGYPYIVTLLNGTVYDVDVSSPVALQEMTKTVMEVSKYKPGMVEAPYAAPARNSNPVPSKLGDPSPIKHVLYIIKENRTYDQVFGDLTKDGKTYGNGDPRLCLFGEDVSPNHHALARDFVLLDNLYASGEVSVDGHHWSKGAYVPDFMQRTWPQQYSGKGAPRLTENLSATPSGWIWNHIDRAGKSFRTYYYHTTEKQNVDWAAARRKGVRDMDSVQIFIDEFKAMEKAGTVPNFMVMALSEDHTRGTANGAFTPKACVASNDIGVGKIVEAISHSSLWKEFLIIAVEDDAQNGADHVDAHRTVALVASPYTRNVGIDSTHYTTTSLLRTIELILGAKPMSQFDAAATPLYKSFRMKPDLTPYKLLQPKTDVLAKNAPSERDSLTASIDFSEPDQMTLAQEIALNKEIWHSIKGQAVPYPGTVRRYSARVPERDDDD